MFESVPFGYVLVRFIFSQHRSMALAFRHLQALRRQFPAPDFFVRIEARRNARGRFSGRGQFFTFGLYELEREEEEEEEEIEYAGAFDSP